MLYCNIPDISPEPSRLNNQTLYTPWELLGLVLLYSNCCYLFQIKSLLVLLNISKAGEKEKRQIMAEELALDLDELRRFQSLAKRPKVLSILSSEIQKLEKLSKQPVSAPFPTPTPTLIATGVKVPSDPALTYVTLASFSWDQDNDKVKIYVSLEGVEKEKVETEFKPMSFDVKFHDVNGKNYRCCIPKLNKEIVPEKCTVSVKPVRVVITLYKASKGNWLDLHYKEDKLKPNLDKERDPMAGIMDLMKNMYEEGDEEMKRTIAKAWTDARSGKTADPLKGYR